MYKIIQPLSPSSLLRNLRNGSNVILHNTRDTRRAKLNGVVDLTEHKGQIIMIHDEASGIHYITNDTLVSILHPRPAHAPCTFWLRPQLRASPTSYHIFPSTKLLLNQLVMYNSTDYIDTEGYVSCGQFHAWQTLDFHTYRMTDNGKIFQFAIRSVEEPYPAYETIVPHTSYNMESNLESIRL